MEYPNWFKQTAEENFKTHLAEFAGKPYLNFLQIGAFTGDASLWLLDNILTDPVSSLEDVDTWQGSDEDVHAEMDFADVYQTYLTKLTRKVRYNHGFRTMKSVDFFMKMVGECKYDFIYIDGDHTASGVLDDAVMGWNTLRVGGIMAFDDYTWGSPKGALYTPKPAIDTFLAIKQGQYEVLAINSQVWVRKI